MNISVVIPNYNGRDLLLQNIPLVVESLLSYHKGEKELIVVDDGSKDDSMEVLSELAEKYEKEKFIFTIIKNTVNQGFSPTVNRGVASAMGEVVILLNSDVRPNKNFLDSLLPHFKDEEVFAVGCVDESVEDNVIVLRGRGIGKWERGLMNHAKGEHDRNTTLWVSGGSGAFRKSLWEKLGGLDPIYAPFYWEDIDLSYRAQKAGYKVLFEDRSRVIHEHEKGAIKTGFKKRKIKVVSYRNQFLFCWINISDRILLFQHILWMPYHLLSAIKRKDTPFFLGFISALGKYGKALSSRRRAQALAKVSDKEVVQQFVEES